MKIVEISRYKFIEVFHTSVQKYTNIPLTDEFHLNLWNPAKTPKIIFTFSSKQILGDSDSEI